MPYCLKLALLVSMKVSIVAKDVVAASTDNFNRSVSRADATAAPSRKEMITKGNSKKALGHMVSMTDLKLLARTKAASGSGATKMSCNWIVAAACLGDMTPVPRGALPRVPACRRRRHSCVRASAESQSQTCRATDIATHAWVAGASACTFA